MSRAYNVAVPLFVLLAVAWLCSGTFLQVSWATFCASVLHMSEVNILRIYIISLWLFLVGCTAFVLMHCAVLLVPSWRRCLRPRAVSHIAILASLYVIAVCAVIVSKPKFQKLYRVFQAANREIDFNSLSSSDPFSGPTVNQPVLVDRLCAASMNGQ
jgi:glucan phosphoethanolaminetransferase (alkaline phosphatase superfamily)